MALPAGYSIEVIERGVGEDSGLGAALVHFWTEHGALTEGEAQARLAHVVCVLRDRNGAVAASSSAFDSAVALLGNRRFWVLRCFAPTPLAREAVEAMLVAVRTHLADGVGAEGCGRSGSASSSRIPTSIRERREAIWDESEMVFAGWTAGCEQLRISYFEGAEVC